MKKGILILSLVSSLTAFSQDWEGISVPADAGEGREWQLLEEVSDKFNYFADAADKGDTFNTKWKDSYVNAWTGGSNTTWQPDQCSANGSMLVLDANRKPGTTDEVIAGCLSSRQPISYPVFVETRAKLSTSVLASCFWMISLDQTQEIDIIEAFGTDRPGKEWYNTRQHLSHHVFIRSPFQDYQPRDVGSWYTDGTVWSEEFHRVGVYWRDSLHLEYYIDGELVRVVHDRAFANYKNGSWSYSIPNVVDGNLEMSAGYQVVTQYATSSEYSFETLQEASAASPISVIDAYGYTESGLTKPEYLVISTAQQLWTGMEATDKELEDKTRAFYYLDWIRVYKAVKATGTAPKNQEETAIRVFPSPCTDKIHIESGATLSQVELLDINGALIRTERVNTNSLVVATSELPRGLYILRMASECGKIFNKRIIKR